MGHYLNLINRLARIPSIDLQCLGHIKLPGADYPFYLVRSRKIERDEVSLKMCLAAGVHGNEPAGVEAVVRLLEKRPDFHGISLSVFPCLNPVGYDLGTRENGEGVDLNRHFHEPDPPYEIALVRQAVAKGPYDLFICCHDDREANGFYLYEAKRGKRPALGPSIISAIREVAPIDRRPKIDGRTNEGGVIIPANWHYRKNSWPMALYLYRLGTPHCLILETPGSQPFEEQVGIHMKALDHTFWLFLKERLVSKELVNKRKS